MAKPWHERRDLPWSKVWMDWWTSLSHAECSAATIGIGIYLQTVANQRGREEGGAGWVLGAGGRPMSVGAIARGAHATPDEVQEAIAELLDAGTLVQRADGAIGFPNLQRYQESADAARKRGQRSTDESEDSPSDTPRKVRGHSADSPEECPAQTSDDQTSDDQKIRGERQEARAGPRETAETPDAPRSLIPRPALSDYVEAWNRGRAEAAADLGHEPNVKASKPGKPPGALKAAVKRYPDVEAWRWCAYALSTSWKATKEGAFDGYGLAWVAALKPTRLEQEMLAGAEARERGRHVPRAGPAPPRAAGHTDPLRARLAEAEAREKQRRTGEDQVLVETEPGVFAAAQRR